MIALLALLIAVNFIVSAFNARVDLTEGNVYTLSPGTKAILSKLEAPVRLRFYYTQGSNAVPVGLKTFAQRVEDLLAEYQRRRPTARSSSRNSIPSPIRTPRIPPRSTTSKGR